jgi:hypothetical protein
VAHGEGSNEFIFCEEEATCEMVAVDDVGEAVIKKKRRYDKVWSRLNSYEGCNLKRNRVQGLVEIGKLT